MIQSQELTDALNKKSYKTVNGQLKALREIAKANEKGAPTLAREALAMVDYLEKKKADDRFSLALVEYARIVGVKPSQLTRAQVKAQRQQFDIEEASK